MNFRDAKKYLAKVGPGLITGAADDDPSGIATYSQTGALFGYSQLWLTLFSFPFMTAVQEMCGRIGLVTGEGLASVLRRNYPKTILGGAVILLVIANTINIGADLGAMAASVQLLIPLPFIVLLLFFTAFTLLLEIFVPYPTYARFLKYLTISLVAYIITAFLVKQDWQRVFVSTLVPHLSLGKDYVLNVAAFLGTTISPYLFFWQADEEVEEEIEEHKIREEGKGKPKISEEDIGEMRFDTGFGMLVSNVIAFFIMLTVAATLASSHKEISSAADAASALKPFAGNFAFLLFALGIVGTGLLAVPVLAGSAGYAVSESFGWKVGLGKRFSQAPGFYAVIALATAVGLIVNFLPVPPMKMLYYSAVANGLLAPPLL
ncbi:MAG: divalent metal cation transporter, partial [Candidatus Kaiserbacteria bacterium]|nr:divalent metal cation transporter [Candidatus Kaiserbacteria bacterium]